MKQPGHKICCQPKADFEILAAWQTAALQSLPEGRCVTLYFDEKTANSTQMYDNLLEYISL